MIDQSIQQQDAAAMIEAFGEPVIFRPESGRPIPIQAIINRKPPQVISEDGKVLADYIEVQILKDPQCGATFIQEGRDQIDIARHVGRTPSAHLITRIIQGDGGMWVLAVK